MKRQEAGRIRGNLNRRHGHCSREVGAHSPTWTSWRSMRDRCQNPNAAQFRYYGAKGIKVCERWERFENFLADMGERPSGHTLDRFPNKTGDYEPTNCRWATPKQQARNRSSNTMLSHEGRTMTIGEWSRELGMAKSTIGMRLKNGWSVSEALSIPKQVQS